jgi:antitoxin ParD1/3/4
MREKKKWHSLPFLLTEIAKIAKLTSKERWHMATMNVSLPAPMKEWVEQQSDGGRYGNASDYVRDLIRQDQARQASIAALQVAIDAGLNSGPPVRFDAAAFKLRMRERHLVR